MIDARALRLALFTDTYTPQINGVARTLERLTSAVQSRGGAVRVFTVEDPEQEEDPAVERFTSRPFWAYPQLRLAWPAWERIQAAIHSFQPTILHAATEFGVGLAGRRVALAEGIPFVSSYHTSFAAYAAHYSLGFLAEPGWAFLRWFHNGGERTYCPTQSIAAEITARGFHRCTVWSRGVDTARFHPAFRSEAIRQQIGASDDTLVVSYVGRLASEKGIAVALDAIRFVAEARPGKAVFLIVGDGPYEGILRERAPKGTHFLGRLTGDALSAAYASSDLFLFPSTTDTFGNVMLEAMASGVPVLGANVGPTRELLLPDRGWLAEPGNAPAFAAQIMRLIDDRALLYTTRERALDHAARQSWDAIWDALITDYLTLQRRNDPGL